MDIIILLTQMLVVIGVLTFLLMFYNSKRKSLSYNYQIISSNLHKDDEFKDKIKMIFEDNKVTNIYIVKIKIFNSGNVSITPNNYHSPLFIDFGENSKIISSKIVDKIDKSLQIEPVKKNGKLEIEPVLLNKGGWLFKGDWFILKILISGKETKKPDIYGRIEDIKKFTYSTEKYNLMKWLFVFGLGFILASFVYTSWAIFSGYAIESNDVALQNTLFLAMIGFFILLIPIFWLDYKYKIGRKQKI